MFLPSGGAGEDLRFMILQILLLFGGVGGWIVVCDPAGERHDDKAEECL